MLANLTNGVHASGDGAAGAPVLAVGAVEETVIDEVAAQGGGVGVALPEDQVHRLLRVVATTGFELLGEPVEHHQPLGMGGGNRHQPAVLHEP